MYDIPESRLEIFSLPDALLRIDTADSKAYDKLGTRIVNELLGLSVFIASNEACCEKGRETFLSGEILLAGSDELMIYQTGIIVVHPNAIRSALARSRDKEPQAKVHISVHPPLGLPMVSTFLQKMVRRDDFL
jgi:hypothetical protein